MTPGTDRAPYARHLAVVGGVVVYTVSVFLLNMANVRGMVFAKRWMAK